MIGIHPCETDEPATSLTLQAATTRLQLVGIEKTFPGPSGSIEALRDINLTVDDGSFVAIVGPSGCGKSTLLNIVSGLEQPSTGRILFEGEAVADRLGRTAYMHQRDLLLPWRTVLGNAILGLEAAGTQKRVAVDRARELLPRFGLEEFADSYPAVLSGGMRQRVAFLRTVLTEKPIFLLDEPFGALDALTRATMQEWLLGLWDELRRTILFITHDVEEALLLADRVAVMSGRPGHFLQVVEVPLPRPRRYEMISDPEFVRLKSDLLESLRRSMQVDHR